MAHEYSLTFQVREKDSVRGPVRTKLESLGREYEGGTTSWQIEVQYLRPDGLVFGWPKKCSVVQEERESKQGRPLPDVILVLLW